MKRRTKQFVTACLIVAAVTGTGAVSARADYHGIPDKVTLAQSKRSVAQGKKFEVKAHRLLRMMQRTIISAGRLFPENPMSGSKTPTEAVMIWILLL